MDDLNDYWLFTQVVEHQGFSAAARALGVPKSSLSRRIALLETRLGVQLLQRSTRHLTVTDVGRQFFDQCHAMVRAAEAARAVIDHAASEPTGLVRLCCPVSLIQMRVGAMVGAFMAHYPKVRVYLHAVNRSVDIIRDGFDIALRVRLPPLADSDLIVKELTEDHQNLVASPALLDRLGAPHCARDLARFPSLDMDHSSGTHVWRLIDPAGEPQTLPHHPRLITDDMTALRQAALHGVGIVQLPMFVVENDLTAGRLVRVLPDWSSPAWLVHAVFASRRGQVPAVRHLLDFLAREFRRGN